MKRRRVVLTVFFTIVFLISCTAYSSEVFYEGKTLRIIVGYPPGGGYDAYARAFGRHMGKHIPGNPGIVVENMPGAGGMISANYLYKAAKPDGLSIGHFSGGLFFNQLMEQPGVEFDARKFEYVGAAVTGGQVFLLMRASGIKTMDQFISSERPIKIGSSAPGSSTCNAARILKATIGLPIKIITGYKGINPIRLAAEGGEVDGTNGAWYGVRVSWRKLIEDREVAVVVQLVSKPFPDIPQVPLAIDFAKTAEARKLIKTGIHDPALFAWPLVLPPGTPEERVLILRNALQESLKDKEFLAEAEKAKMGLDPVSGEGLQDVIAQLFQTDPALIAKLKRIIFQ